MRRYTLITAILLTSLIHIVSAQAPDTLWTKTYGTAGNEAVYSIDQTADGGFIMGGAVNFGSDTSDLWLIRTNSQGDTLWTRTFGGPGEDVCQSGQATYDGGYIMAALGEMWLIKTDANGDTLWTRRTGGPGGSEAPWVEQTADSGYIITGNITDEVNHAQVGLIKTDSVGNTLWTKTYGGTGDEFGRSVQQTTDSGYIIVAVRPANGSQDIWLLKTDTDGDTTWTRTFNVGSDGDGSKVMQTADSGYAILGLIFGTLESPEPDSEDRDWLLIKTDSLGTLQWSQTFGADSMDQSMDMLLTDDGGFLLTGWLDRSDIERTADLWLVKADELGDTLWTTVLGGTSMDVGIGLVQIAEGEYAVAGGTGSWGAGGFDGWLVRYGEAVVAVDEAPNMPAEFVLHANYPNPFNPITTIRYDLPELANVSLIVYDLLGREVVRLVEGQVEVGYHMVVWNGRTADGLEMSTGVYIARLVTAEYSKSIKMLLLK